MNKVFTENGWADYVYWQKEDRKTLKKINSLIGYRTTLSMSNEEAWNFSQKYSSKILFITGLIMLIPSILVHIPFYGKDEDTISILSVIVLCVQLITIIACIIPVEIKLRKKFKDR